MPIASRQKKKYRFRTGKIQNTIRSRHCAANKTDTRIKTKQKERPEADKPETTTPLPHPHPNPLPLFHPLSLWFQGQTIAGLRFQPHPSPQDCPSLS